MKRNSKRHGRTEPLPSVYPHHVEACIRAGGDAARALLLFIKVLEDEQTPAARKRKRRIARAGRMLERSSHWASAARRKPKHNPR